MVGLMVYHQAFGWMALGASLLALWLRNSILNSFALCAALAGLVLYNGTTASFAFVLAALTAARLARKDIR
jgi:hypothetical protein